MSNIQTLGINTLKKMNLKGGTVIDGFATTGITNTIASECILHSINTQLVATIESPYFSQLSIVRNSVPYFPVRIYANEELKTSIFISEVSIDPSLYFLIGNTMLNWAKENECDLIISSSNIVNPQQQETVNQTEYSIMGIGNTLKARNKLKDSKISLLKNGTVGGIPAVLLNQSSQLGINIIILLVKIIEGIPDFRAAAELSTTISNLVPGVSCNVPLLLQEAEKIEKELTKIKSQDTENEMNAYG
ncbi:MAG: proteasome assembly chaperone family protein [Thaumarchaeota archaeon]|nr:MAG: proteasome assembly chaperone family protein [Nitrososphaerota archaeon]